MRALAYSAEASHGHGDMWLARDMLRGCSNSAVQFYYIRQLTTHDKMGILLFGTEKTNLQKLEGDSIKGHSYPHCYLLIDLDVPDAAGVKTLKRLVENEEEAARLLVPSKEPVSMANVLFCSNQIF